MRKKPQYERRQGQVEGMGIAYSIAIGYHTTATAEAIAREMLRRFGHDASKELEKRRAK